MHPGLKASRRGGKGGPPPRAPLPPTTRVGRRLNPNDAADGKGTTLSGTHYTNLEMYLNELAGDPVTFRK